MQVVAVIQDWDGSVGYKLAAERYRHYRLIAMVNRKSPGRTGAESCGRADEGNRTPNLLITNQLLYQLSYVSGIHERRFPRPKESSSAHRELTRAVHLASM